MDALRLIAESLSQSLDHALRDRGGIGEVRRRSSGHPTHFAIRVEFSLPSGDPGFFAFKVGARPGGAFVVQREECQVGTSHYRVESGELKVSPGSASPPSSDSPLPCQRCRPASVQTGLRFIVTDGILQSESGQHSRASDTRQGRSAPPRWRKPCDGTRSNVARY